jgi:hypothetical protein
MATKKRRASSESTASGRRGSKNARASSPRRRRGTVVAVKLDRLFDSGSDEIDDLLDWKNARRPGRAVRRVTIYIPADLLRAIDREAKRLGLKRKAFIESRLAKAFAMLR